MHPSIAFDDYVDRVRDANTLYLKTGPTVSDWGVEGYILGRASLQYGADGGPRIIHGVMRNDAVGLIMQAIETQPVLLDGKQFKCTDLAVFGPGSHFVFSATVPTRWFSLGISLPLFKDQRWKDAFSCLPEEGNTVFSLTTNVARGLVGAAHDAHDTLKQDPADVPKAKAGLLCALRDALLDRQTERTISDRHYPSQRDHVEKVLEYVRQHSSSHIRVAEIAKVAELDRRSLQRVFKKHLNMTPKEYLLLRQLNLVRLALRRTPGETNVTQILVAQGVNELGRFSASYKDLFGELPSETRRRARELASI